MAATFNIGKLEAVLALRDQLTPTLNMAAGNLQRLAGTFAAAGTALTAGVTVPIVAIGGAAIKLGMDAIESENLMRVAFGGMTDAAVAWSKQLSDSLGLNEFELRRTAGTLNTMFESMGLGKQGAFDMSTGLVQLSADMASFFNLNPTEAFDKLRAGIVGETEPLRRLGILVDETTIKTFAYRTGLVAQGEELTQQEKVLARYGSIMEQTSKAQGDLARTLDSPTNQLRIMRAQLTETATALGLALMPVFQQFTGLLSAVVPHIKAAVESFSSLPTPVKTGAVVLAGLAAAIGPLLLVLAGLAAGVAALLPLLPVLGAAIGVLLGPVGLVAAGVVALALAWRKWGDDITRVVSETMRRVKQWLVDFWEGSIFQSVARLLQAFAELWIAIGIRIVQEVSSLMAAVKNWLIDKLAPIVAAISSVLEPVVSIWRTAKETVIGIVTALYTGVKTWLVDKFTAIVAAIKDKIDAVTGFFRDMKQKIVGGSFVPDMISGIKTEFGRLNNVMTDPTQRAVDQVLALFQGLSHEVTAAMDRARHASDGFIAGLQQLRSGDRTAGLTGMATNILGIADAFRQATAQGNAFQKIAGGAAVGAQVGSMFGPIGTAIGAGIGAIGGGVRALFTKAEQQVNPIRQAFIDAAGGLAVLNERAHEAGVTLNRLLDAKNPKAYEAAIKDLNTALQFQDDAMKVLDETVQKYGFSIEQLGPKFAAQKLNEQAAQLFQDYQVLTAAGIEHVLVIERMAPTLQQYVTTALNAGAAIPEHLRPVLEQMLEMGLLTDASGQKMTDLARLTFTETLDQKFLTLIETINKLVDAITRVGDTSANVANRIPKNPYELWRVPDIPPIVEAPELPGFQGGTRGRFVDFGRGSLALLHGRERIVTEREGRASVAATPGPIHVHVHINGREAAEAIVPEIPRVLSLHGLAGGAF